jgi:hypothetical protein
LQIFSGFSAVLAVRTITEKSMQVDTVNSGTVQRDAKRGKETSLISVECSPTRHQSYHLHPFSFHKR